MKKRALLIGINDYDFLGELSFARKDAEDFSSALKSRCGFRDGEITLMTCGSKGGLRGISRYIEHKLSDLTRLRDLDLLIFGFWGHGFAPSGRRYLCGMDTEDDDLERTAVSLDLVKAKLAQTGALNTLLVLDCCQNRPAGRGVAVDLEKGAEEQFASMARDIQTSRKHGAGKGVPTTAIMNSCREGQRAFEWEDREHGIFTAHLLDGLAEGKTSIAQLATHVCDLTPETARALYHKEQVPWFFIEGRGDIELPAAKAPPPRPRTGNAPQWWVTVKGKEQGPLGEAGILALIETGKITASDQCWREGMDGWEDMAKRPEWAERFRERPKAKPARPPRRKPPEIILPDCEIVRDAKFAPLEGLAAGSAEAQARQREWVEKGYPLEVRETITGMVFRLIPPGEFMMGSPDSEPERYDNENPLHKVNVASAFMIAKHAVTRGQFAAFINATGRTMEGGANVWDGREWKIDPKASWQNPGFVQDDRHPVVCVSWEDARAFTDWLSCETGQDYRLLSEAEWEYACRAGTDTPFCFGNTISTDQANYDGNHVYDGGRKGAYRKATVPAGSFPANAFGLHDMHGNVWEWCEDCFHDSYHDAPKDGLAWITDGCRLRILRGGGWDCSPKYLRSASRDFANPHFWKSNNGFRVARSLP